MLASLTVLWLFISSALAGMYSGTPVVELTAKNFKREVLQNGNVTLVEFYAPWCGHCQRLAPEYAKSARMLNGLARVGAVNCDKASNKGLCQKYKIQGFPTIKVFQPAKLTDVDFKNAAAGEDLPTRKPRVYNYQGPREAKALNTFAISKLRNYAASLVNDSAIAWLKPNRIPRVVMLPGKKYKSKSIAPLFKVLSREYFGKLRFGYIPRRIDGAWNLLGVKAPDESQLVYMSDDREPLVYRGSMSKKAVKMFLDEQYSFELQRREHRGMPVEPDREEAANGLEWVLEDAQEAEMEHMAERRRKQEHEQELLREAAEAARRRLGKTDKVAVSHTSSTTATTATTTTTTASETTNTADGEEAEDFDYEDDTDNTANDADQMVDSEFDDVEGAGIDWGDDAAEAEALLDEVNIDLTPEDIVEEGPEAVAKYKAMLESYLEEQKASSSASVSTAQPPKITPHVNYENGLPTVDEVIKLCIRWGGDCVLMTTPGGQFQTDDKLVIIRSLPHIPRKIKETVPIHLIVDDETDHPDLHELVQNLGVAYPRQRTDADGNQKHAPGLLYFSARRREFAVFDGDYTAVEVAKFVVAGVNRKLPTQKIPDPVWFWVTEDDLERMDAEENVSEQPSHDEL